MLAEAVGLLVTQAALVGRARAADRVSTLLAQMTRDEKVALAASGEAGVPRLGIPGLVPTAGPNGVRLDAPGRRRFRTRRSSRRRGIPRSRRRSVRRSAP